MRWFLLTASFQILHPGSSIYQFDEQVMLLKAENGEDALTRGKTLARKEELAFTAAGGETVKWNFLGIIDLKEIDDLTDFIRVGSITRELQNPRHYIHDIKRRSVKQEINILK